MATGEGAQRSMAGPTLDEARLPVQAMGDGTGVVAPAEPLEVDFAVDARLSSLPIVRRRVEQMARLAAKMGPEDLEKLRLVLSEVVANAVAAHEGQVTDGRLHLRCVLGPDRLDVSVVDQGGGFVVTGSHPVVDTSLPDVTSPEVQQREGGFGLGLIDAFADETEFQPVDGGTAVRFVIYPGGDPPATPA